jgi:GntR family transcriptional regulator
MKGAIFMSPLEEKKADSVADSLRDRIKRGEFGTGGRLPPVSQLAKDYQTTRPTTYQALALLQGEGLLVTKGNSFYAHNMVRISTGVVPPFEDVLANQGIDSTVRNIIEPEIITMPDEIAALFDTEKGQRTIHRYRVQGQAGAPYRLSEYWFPEQLALPYLQRLKDEPGYDILEDIKSDLGVKKQTVRDKVLARIPTKNEASLLSISRGTPVQEVRRINRTLDGQVLMYHLIVFVGPFSILEYDYEITNRKPLRGETEA